MSDTNKMALLRWFEEVWNQGREATIDELFADIDLLDVGMDSQVSAINAALTVLGSRGLVGFDLGDAAFFHRELPFDLQVLDKLQPRLKSARKLIADDKVSWEQRDGQIVGLVDSGDVQHRVRLMGGSAKCTCPWFAKHESSRGPCKHILAVRILIEEQDE